MRAKAAALGASVAVERSGRAPAMALPRRWRHLIRGTPPDTGRLL
jgi:hypothetical protein